MRIPRDISAKYPTKQLSKLGYEITRKKGSHIRLSIHYPDGDHYITIPDHNPVKIGTLNNILNGISFRLNISKEELIKLLFD